MKIALTMIVAAASTLAQGPGFGPRGPGAGPQRAQPAYTELKAYLQLTDAQIQSLQQIQQQQRQAVQQTFEQINQKQTSLRQLLDGNTTDAAAVGRLVLEIETLRKQVRDSHASFAAQAVNVLNAAQKTKLATLQEAEKLGREIQQARMLQLITPTETGRGPMMGPGGPSGFGGGMGMFRFRRPE